MSQLPTPPTPTPFKRNPDTGLVEGIVYHYSPDGKIDWRRHCPPQFMYIIREREAAVLKAQGKPLAEVDLSLVDERWLRIKQAGFNYLANLRGYTSLQYHSLVSTDGKSAVVCEMSFIGNVETDHYPLICSAIASATIHSTGRDFASYLECFAENRAFARCVKRALQINILSEDEIDAEMVKGITADSATGVLVNSELASPSGFQPHHHLADKCRTHKPAIAFESLKAAAIKLKGETAVPPENKPHAPFQGDPAGWTSFEDIQPIDVWFLVGKIEEKSKVATEAGAAKGKAKT